MKLVISDLDGTLLNNESIVSDKTKDTIKKLRATGVEFAIATGRSFSSANEIKKSMGMDIFLICNNGANIYGKDGKLIKRNFIPKDLSKKIIEMLHENKIEYFAFNGEDLYIPSEMTVDLNLIREHRFFSVDKNNYNILPELEKILIIEEEPQKLSRIKDLLHRHFDNEVEIVISADDCIDINMKNCSKKEGLAFIAEHLKVDKNEIMAFGDSGNDYKMLKYVKIPVAMKGSYMSKTGEFDNITEYSNSEDGVARFLDKFFKL